MSINLIHGEVDLQWLKYTLGSSQMIPKYNLNCILHQNIGEVTCISKLIWKMISWPPSACSSFAGNQWLLRTCKHAFDPATVRMYTRGTTDDRKLYRSNHPRGKRSGDSDNQHSEKTAKSNTLILIDDVFSWINYSLCVICLVTYNDNIAFASKAVVL